MQSPAQASAARTASALAVTLADATTKGIYLQRMTEQDVSLTWDSAQKVTLNAGETALSGVTSASFVRPSARRALPPSATHRSPPASKARDSTPDAAGCG